jgi:hypothetical protein
MIPTDYVLLVLTVGGVATFSVRLRQLAARRRLPCVDFKLLCPRTGGATDCRIAVDARSGRHVEAVRCSQFGGKHPECNQDCVKLLNLGIPLETAESGACKFGDG